MVKNIAHSISYRELSLLLVKLGKSFVQIGSLTKTSWVKTFNLQKGFASHIGNLEKKDRVPLEQKTTKLSPVNIGFPIQFLLFQSQIQIDRPSKQIVRIVQGSLQISFAKFYQIIWLQNKKRPNCIWILTTSSTKRS